MPVAENRTRLIYSFFFRDISDAVQEQNERTIETNCDIVREDFGICERSQANLEAGIFQRGPDLLGGGRDGRLGVRRGRVAAGGRSGRGSR